MASPCDVQVGTLLNVADVGLWGSNVQSGRILLGVPVKRPLPSLGLFTEATTPPWWPATAAATVEPEADGTNLNGLSPAVTWMRSNRASSSCFEPVPVTTSESAFAAAMKSCAAFHGLSSLTQTQN